MSTLFYERNRNKIFLFFVIVCLSLLFQDVIQQYYYQFKWIDELVGVGFLPITLILFLAKEVKLYREEKVILALFILTIISGALSSLINGYQNSIAEVSDLVINSKFLGAYLFARVMFYELNIKEYIKYLRIIFRLITVIVFLTTIFDMIWGLFPKVDKRFFIYSEKLLFYHPTYLALFCIVILSYLTLVSENKFIDYVFIAQIMFVCASTFRAKALGLLVVYIILLIFIKKNKGIRLSYIIAAALLIVILFIPQINKYYVESSESPRNALTTTGFKIANDYFPIGAGFGTFGSYVSGEYYSPIYVKYKIDTVWGLEKKNVVFISDTFWPMIMGQFGYVGLISYVILVISFFFLIKRILSINTNYFFFALTPYLYLIISSTAESSFSNYYSCSLFIMIGLAVNQLRINDLATERRDNIIVAKRWDK